MNHRKTDQNSPMTVEKADKQAEVNPSLQNTLTLTDSDT